MTLELATLAHSFGLVHLGNIGLYSRLTDLKFTLFWGPRNWNRIPVPENENRVSGPGEFDKKFDFFGAKATLGRKSRGFQTGFFNFWAERGPAGG